MRKINVLHIIEQLPLGGAENLLLVLAKNIDQEKFNLIFWCLNNEGYIADKLKEEGFKVVCFGNYRLRYFYKKLLDMIRLINSDEIDIVHTHLIVANQWGRIAALLSNHARICKTEHGSLLDVSIPGYLKRKIYFIIERLLDGFTDRIVYVSKAHLRDLTKGNHNSHKHIVIHNGFDDRRFSIDKPKDSLRQQYGFSENVIIIGIVGSLFNYKGHEYLFKAAVLVKRMYPNIKLLIIGKGPEEGRLRKLALSIKIDTVFMSDRWDVPQLLKAMDIYVQPSIKESFGIGIVEAMYSGLPVVATKTGGIPEVVQGEGTGILVPPRNSEALSEALLNLIGNPEMANRMGERGRKIAASKFSGRRYAKEMEKLYVSLLSGFHS